MKVYYIDQKQLNALLDDLHNMLHTEDEDASNAHHASATGTLHKIKTQEINKPDELTQGLIEHRIEQGIEKLNDATEDIYEVIFDLKKTYNDLFDTQKYDPYGDPDDEDNEYKNDMQESENATTCSPDMPEVQPVPRQPIPDMPSIFQMAHECLTNLEQATKPKHRK